MSTNWEYWDDYPLEGGDWGPPTLYSPPLQAGQKSPAGWLVRR